MIRFSKFIDVIHNSIVEANDSLMNKNVGLLEKYFEETTTEIKDEDTGETKSKTILDPKSVILEYPTINADGQAEYLEVHVPLITLIPLQMSQIEKAVLTTDFEIELVNGEVGLSFKKERLKSGDAKWPEKNRCKLELVLTPQETSEGLKLLVEGYEAILRKQFT